MHKHTCGVVQNLAAAKQQISLIVLMIMGKKTKWTDTRSHLYMQLN